MAREHATGRPTVQLRHASPDGSCHVDWLLAPDEAGAEPLVSFRLPDRLDHLTAGRQLDADRIPDHRPLYLDYEGPVSRGRGEVTRLRRGVVRQGEMAGDAWRLEVAWLEPGPAAAVQTLHVQRRAGDQWIIKVLARTPAGVAQ
ncbi:MAG: hypothetical protein ACYTGG_12235 [Planctomycetota bacterium]|jgi:hypothetical protein